MAVYKKYFVLQAKLCKYMTKGSVGMTGRLERYLQWSLFAALLIGAVWIILRYLLPWCAPFIIAIIIAAIMEPGVRFLIKRGWPRSAASGIWSLTILGLLTTSIIYIISRCVVEISTLAAATPQLLENLGQTLSGLEERVLSWIDGVPDGANSFLGAALSSLTESLYRLPALVYQKLLSLMGSLAQNSPGVLLFFVTTAIGVYFISASWPDIYAFMRRQIPARFHSRLHDAKSDFHGTMSKFLRAQLLLIIMTFTELIIALNLLHIPGPVTISLIIALLDALPVLGAGTALIPWALYCLLIGNVPLGIGLLVTYGIITILRNCVQPKLLSDQIGLHPIVSLAALYIGWCAFGVAGMLLFPIIAVTLTQLNDRGVIRIYRRG